MNAKKFLIRLLIFIVVTIFIVNKVKHMLDALTVRLLSEESYEKDFDRNYSKYLKYYRKRMY